MKRTIKIKILNCCVKVCHHILVGHTSVIPHVIFLVCSVDVTCHLIIRHPIVVSHPIVVCCHAVDCHHIVHHSNETVIVWQTVVYSYCSIYGNHTVSFCPSLSSW